MIQTLTVYTERGRSDSVRQPVKVVFTITPAESKRSTWPMYAIEFDTMTFGDTGDLEESRELVWSTELAYQSYNVVAKGAKSYCKRYGPFQKVMPGQSRMVTRGASNPGEAPTTLWAAPELYADRVAALQSSLMAVNKTGVPQNISLHCRVRSSWWSMAAYHQVKDSESIITPLELELQAYVVDTAIDYGGVFMLADDLSRPLFTTPLSCDTLPATSRWKLSQDKSGAFKLTNDLKPESAFYSTQTNVERLERMITSHQDGLSNRVQAVEDQTAKLATLLNQIESRLAAAETTVGRVEKTAATGGQPSAAVDRRLTAVEKSDAEMRGDIPMIQKTLMSIRLQLDDVAVRSPGGGGDLGRTQRDLAEMRESIATDRNQMTSLDRRIAAVEATAKKLMEVMDGDDHDAGEDVLFPQGDSPALTRSRENTVFPPKFSQ